VLAREGAEPGCWDFEDEMAGRTVELVGEIADSADTCDWGRWWPTRQHGSHEIVG
jgi:hypothetical protein